MVHTIKINNKVYVYMNGKLLYKKYIDGSQSGIVFDVMAYRRGDSLVSYTDKTKEQ